MKRRTTSEPKSRDKSRPDDPIDERVLADVRGGGLGTSPVAPDSPLTKL